MKDIISKIRGIIDTVRHMSPQNEDIEQQCNDLEQQCVDLDQQCDDLEQQCDDLDQQCDDNKSKLQADVALSPSPSEEKMPTKRELVKKAILKRCHEINPEDIPQIEEEMSPYFEEQKNGDYFNNFASEDYFRLLDLRDMPDTRVVVVGDIHCDFISLAALLLKLSVSDYDYFEKAYFVFLGDYLDRGTAYFEPLLLLMDLQHILGNRLIMLKGNHELIGYDEESQMMTGLVIPQDSVPVLNQYCGENKKFLQLFANFYSTLPTYVYLKTKGQNVLLTHAAIPRQIFLNTFRFDTESGAIIFEEEPLSVDSNASIEMADQGSPLNSETATRLLNERNMILYDMIWGDPAESPKKLQVKGRFMFGSMQFEAYADKNFISRVFRSHEPEEYGIKAYYHQRLYTVFSTGGENNPQTGYERVHPAFAVIRSDGSYFLESSYVYKLDAHGQLNDYFNPFTHEVVDDNEAGYFCLNSEFFCSRDDAEHVLSVFDTISKEFSLSEEEDDEERTQTDRCDIGTDAGNTIADNSATSKQPSEPSGRAVGDTEVTQESIYEDSTSPDTPKRDLGAIDRETKIPDDDDVL